MVRFCDFYIVRNLWKILGHQRAIMGNMTVEEIYQDRKKFAKQVFEVASSDLIQMGITVVSYTLKDITDNEGYDVSACQLFTSRYA